MQNSTLNTSIEIQIGTDLYERIKHAADLQGISIADFALNAIRRAAQQTIDATEVITLSYADQYCLADSLLNPPEPNDALKRSLARHAQHCVRHTRGAT